MHLFNLSTFHVRKKQWHATKSLFMIRKQHRDLKRKQKKIYQKRLSINAHCFQVQQSIVTSTSKYNLAKGLDFKKPVQIPFL